MAQAYMTTYRKVHRWLEYPPIKRYKDPTNEGLPESPFAKELTVREEVEKDMKACEERVKKMLKRRLHSIYGVDYNHELKTHEEEGDDEEKNELLEYGRLLYDAEKPQVTPPLPGARKIFNYMRPESLHTPFTMYQHVHGRVGYEILNGTVRETAKKQKEKLDAIGKAKDDELNAFAAEIAAEKAAMEKGPQESARVRCGAEMINTEDLMDTLGGMHPTRVLVVKEGVAARAVDTRQPKKICCPCEPDKEVCCPCE